MPDQTYGGRVNVVAWNRYCTGYKKSNMGTRSVLACLAWVQTTAPWARYFFFREEGNYHCSPCPDRYKGHRTSYTSYQNSLIFTYEIVGWKFDETWGNRVRIVARNRYCTGYKKSNMKLRSVLACMAWVTSVEPWTRYFFFRMEGNYHCSPCPSHYLGHPTTGTGYQNSRIYTYEIIGWKFDETYGGKVKIVARNRYCTGYKKRNMGLRNVISCMNWVQSVVPQAKYFFFRSEGNYHCSPCWWTYKGHPTTGTSYQASRIYTYEITGHKFDETYGNKVRVTARNRYCTGYKKSNYKTRSVEACLGWVRSISPWSRYFFFRSEGNYHCAPCPDRYRGHPT
jgi:hypothetical protein